MTELFTYLLKVNIALSLFYLIYYFWLRKLTFYTINRYFLIFALTFSTLYPLIHIHVNQSSAEKPTPVASNVMPVWEYEYSANQQMTINEHIDTLFYLTLLVFTLRFCISLFGILKIHLSSTASIWNAYHYRKSKEDILPFSFWKNVYLNPEKHSDNELEGIFRHEYVHVRQLHSLDILLAELILIFCWYNPFSWLFRRVIRENIEFITDSNVLASGINKKAYQYSLLTVLTANRQSTIANYFNMKDLKKRISMMNRKQTANMHLFKYVLLIPLVIGCLSIFTISVAKQHTLTPESLSLTTVMGTDDKPTENEIPKGKPFVLIDTISNIDTVKDKEENTLANNLQIRFVKADSLTPLYVIDSELVEKTELAQIDPNDIESISVLKSKGAVAMYGEQAQDGVILITTKNSASTIKADTLKINESKLNSPLTKLNSPLIYIDGDKKTRKDLDVLDPEDIDSVEVYKDKAATDKYGDDGKNGVINITTKQTQSDKN